jgi:glycosyltransferase involved in cell wall biosynthesis
MSSGTSLTYALVTPVRNEVDNLPVLAACLAAQTTPPQCWVIVDSGSFDGSVEVARRLEDEYDWVRSFAGPAAGKTMRGAPIVRAFLAGLAALDIPVDVVVKLDADVTMEPDYFERLVAAFQADDRLGIASGICCELEGEAWVPSYGTRDHVWGASRAYRSTCLQQVLPLEERQGWDEIDAIRAHVLGWTTRTIFDLEFRHHRPEGARDGSRRRWLDQGATAHYMGYRVSYLLLRTLFQAVRDPMALAMLWGYVAAALSRAPRWSDHEARALLRRQQRLSALPLRAAEALGRRG